jgi:hypothetical protein
VRAISSSAVTGGPLPRPENPSLTTALELGDPADAGYGNLRLHHAVAQLSCGHLAEAEESARSAN